MKNSTLIYKPNKVYIIETTEYEAPFALLLNDAIPIIHTNVNYTLNKYELCLQFQKKVFNIPLTKFRKHINGVEYFTNISNKKTSQIYEVRIKKNIITI